MISPALRRLHRWIGLALALPLILQAVTGLIMLAEPLVAALSGAPSATGPLTEPVDLRNVDVAAVLGAAHAAVAADLVPTRWHVQSDAIVTVDFAQPGHQQAAVQVAVDTLFTTVTSVRRNPDSVYRWIHLVHETLLLGQNGRGIIGCVGIALLLMGLSGIPLWWPPRRRWKTAFRVSRGAGGRRLQRELHGATGIWLIGLLLLQSLSGASMAFPQTARLIVGLPGSRVAGGIGNRADAANAVDAERSIVAGVAVAQAVMPRALLQDLRRPPMSGRPMTAVLLPPGRWEGSPAAVVSMDPVSARVLSIQDPETDPPGASALAWLRAVHGGGAAGPVGRLLMCLFALLLPLLPVTGFAMWLMRQRTRRRASAMPQDGPAVNDQGVR